MLCADQLNDADEYDTSYTLSNKCRSAFTFQSDDESLINSSLIMSSNIEIAEQAERELNSYAAKTGSNNTSDTSE